MWKDPREFASNVTLLVLAGLAIATTRYPDFFWLSASLSLLTVAVFGYVLYFRIPSQIAPNENCDTDIDQSVNEVVVDRKAGEQIIVVIPSNGDAFLSYDVIINVKNELNADIEKSRNEIVLWDQFLQQSGAVSRKQWSAKEDSYPDYFDLYQSSEPERPLNIRQFQH